MNTMQQSSATPRRDLSLVAIGAAEELERLKRGFETGLSNVRKLSLVLNDSFSKGGPQAEIEYPIDAAHMISSAFAITEGVAYSKSVSELALQAVAIAEELNDGLGDEKEEDIEKLINFCVALSDSAYLYREEIDQLNSSSVLF